MSGPRVLHPATLRAGDQFGHYRIVRRLGVGGMGAVYLAEDEELGRPVALKLLLGADERAARRFVAEARGQARVEHPAVCRVYEAGERDGQRFIAMRYVEGQTLDQVRDRMTVEQKVRLLQQVCEGIAAAHGLGLIHRDIKPTNVLVTETDDGDWQPFVTDFGLVKDLVGAAEGLTETGIPLGSPSFMAPEQARGEADALGHRTDVYALGATLYDLLGGAPPFVGESPMEIILRVVQADPAPLRTLVPQISPDLEAVVLRCLERDPARRYASATALADDLSRFLDGSPVRARPTGWAYQARRVLLRHRLLVGAVAAALIAVGVLLGLAVRTQRQAAHQAELAQQLGQEIKDIEWSMRAAHLAPPHDITAEKEAVRAQVEELHARWTDAGQGGIGPAEYALGRGALALGDAPAAAEHLQRAWDAGYQNAEVAYGLGLALATEYQRERSALAAIDRPDIRAARVEEIEEQYRAPAMEYLGAVEASDDVRAAYVEALLAAYDGDGDRALQLLAPLPAQAPWFHEAAALTGQVHLSLAMEARFSGRYDEGLEHLDLAREALLAAAEVGRSDPSVRVALCQADELQMRLHEDRGERGEGIYERGTAACEMATTLDPAAIEAWIRTGAIHRSEASLRMNRGEESAEVLEAALAATGRALELDPDHAGALHQRGLELRERGELELKVGQDPTATFQEGIAVLQRAGAADPALAQAHSELAGVFYYLANYQGNHGGDPTHSLEQGSDAMLRAIELQPGVAQHRANLGSFLVLRSEAETDPDAARQLLEQGVAQLDEAVRLNPSSASTIVKQGWITASLGRLVQAQGGDPSPRYEEALAAYARAAELKPDLFWAHNNAAIVWSGLGAYHASHGQDPAEAYAAARAALDRTAVIDPKHVYAHNNRVDLLANEARWAWGNGADPGPLLADARRAAATAEECRPGYPPTLGNRAILAELEGLDALARGRAPDAALARGLDHIATALEIDPGNEELLAVQARLEVLVARTAARPQEAAAARERAVQAASESLEQRDDAGVRATLAEAHLIRGRALVDEDPGAGADAFQAGLTLLEAVPAEHPAAVRAVEVRLHLAQAEDTGGAEAQIAEAARLDPFVGRRWALLEGE